LSWKMRAEGEGERQRGEEVGRGRRAAQRDGATLARSLFPQLSPSSTLRDTSPASSPEVEGGAGIVGARRASAKKRRE